MGEIKSIFDYMQLLLRYFVSGVVAILVAVYIDQRCMHFCFSLLQKTPWVMVFVAATVGIIINAIHHAIFDDLLLSLSTRIYRIKHNIPELLGASVVDWQKRSIENYDEKKFHAINFGLYSQTYLRRKSENPAVISLENELNKKWSVLNLLYCSFYSMWLVPALTLSKHFVNKTYHINLVRIEIVGLGGLIMLIAALIYDYKITKREIWIADNFFQPVLVNGYRTITFRLSKQKSPNEAPYLSGDFNGWDSTSHPMKDDNNGYWTISHKFPPGEIKYSFTVNGESIEDSERDGISNDGKSLRWID